MVEVWQRIRATGERMLRSVTEETPRKEGSLLINSSLFSSRGFDNPADVGLAALLDASLRRREQEESGGIGQEGFISTNRLLWAAGIALTWAGSEVLAYKAIEMMISSGETSGSLRVALSLPVAFAATIAVDALFLDRLIHPRRTP